MSWKKLKLLVWKNFLLQKRHKWQTIFEIASPVIFSLFLILVRCLVDPVARPETHYEPFSPTFFNVSGLKLESLKNIKNEGTLAFSPDTPLMRETTKNAMNAVVSESFSFLSSFILGFQMMPEPKGFKNSQEMENALSQPNAMKNILVGIQFDDIMANTTQWPDDVVVTLRFPAVMRTPLLEHPLRASWRTNLMFPIFPRPGSREPDDPRGGKMPGYSGEMFLTIQNAISQEIIKQKSKLSQLPKINLQRFPQPQLTDDKLLLVLERFISMIIMLCFAYTFVNTVRVIAAEKELQLKETMTIMGLPSWLHWVAWFIKQFSFILISVLLVVGTLKIPFWSKNYPYSFSVLTHTPSSVLFFILVLFAMASIAFCFLVSVFFNRANTAASFMGLAWFASYSVFMLTQVLYEEISFTTKMLLSLISNTAMGYALQMVIICEGSSRGLQWEDFFSQISYHDDFKPWHVCSMLVVDTILYTLVAMYIEKIKPGLYGVPMPWYFPLTKSFWMPNKSRVAAIRKSTKDDEYADALLQVVHDEEPKGVPMGVHIQNLNKLYKGKKKAVDNLNLRMYENEITVLLGHNGAGKTTTISMLTGTVPPSSGTALINGYDIVRETELARGSLGICPQHNVLFPDLTVAEHIRFYGKLKGVQDSEIDDEINHFLKLLDLESKRDALSSQLSGGQQRRLSVGAALAGASRVVLLDEPSAGLDPAARRALWDLLHKEKKGRTIILTTHFMDEAEVLGDRIAIMSGGRLQCVGRPYFLKKHYGLGYKMTIVKQDGCDVQAITHFLKRYVPDTKLNSNIGMELTYILPNEQISNFPAMFKDLEENKVSLKVSSYGLSVTTLEEVFMKVGAEDSISSSSESVNKDCNNQILKMENGVHPIKTINEETISINEMEPIQKVVGFKLLQNHIKAMFMKLFLNSTRSKLIALIQFLSPVINISISVVIARSWKFISKLPALVLSLEHGFHHTETFMSREPNLTETSIEGRFARTYKEYFQNSSRFGMDIIDIDGANMSQYYLNFSKSEPGRAHYSVLVGASFSERGAVGWFSNYGYHDVAVSLATLNDVLMRTLVPNSTLKVVNHPLPYSIENLVKVMATGSSMGFQFAFNIGFCMAFVTSFLVLFVIKERISGAALVQRVSGLRAGVWWGAALLWDWLWLLLLHLGIVATLALYQENTLATPAELGRILLVLMVFSFAIIPIHYLASFFFEASATGFAKMCFFNIFTGCMPFLIIEVLRIPEVGSPFYANIFDWIFSPLPIYCISRSFRDMSVSSFSLLACDALCSQLTNMDNCTQHTICEKLNITVCCIDDDPYLNWAEPGIGRYLVTMTVVGVVTFSLLLAKEYGLLKKLIPRVRAVSLPPLPAEDGDVSAERAAAHALSPEQLAEHALVCQDLTKYYGDLLAVNRITLAIPRGECFGLLGINGAGKTSTFRVVAGDASPSAGRALVRGWDLAHQRKDAYAHMGYCPQFDALLDNLTARETLRIFCLLKGIPDNIGAVKSMELAKSLGFTRHLDKKIHQCSGGTKRKISTAIAFLGDSTLVLLDEPTTGMDPASKRLVWRGVGQLRAGGRAVLLSSHSMEESEALCSRLAIMVNGRFHCLGPPQHLKNKFSQGYTIIVKVEAGPNRDANVANVRQYLIDEIPDTKHIETYLGISTYYVGDASVPWWRLFEVMQRARGLFPVDDYSVTQTTLEQVFLQFTRLQGQDP